MADLERATAGYLRTMVGTGFDPVVEHRSPSCVIYARAGTNTVINSAYSVGTCPAPPLARR